MIILNQDESMLLLVAKYCAHIEVYKNAGEERMAYIQRVCDHRCFGDDSSEYKSDVYSIYRTLAEKLLNAKQVFSVMDTMNRYKITTAEAMICELASLQVCDVDNDHNTTVVFIDTDDSLVCSSNNEAYHLVDHPVKPEGL